MFKADSIVGAKDLEELKRAIQSQLDRLSYETLLPQPGVGVLLPKLQGVPDKPRDGLVVQADGTNWNPGSGAGLYAYYGGVWNKL